LLLGTYVLCVVGAYLCFSERAPVLTKIGGSNIGLHTKLTCHLPPDTSGCSAGFRKTRFKAQPNPVVFGGVLLGTGFYCFAEFFL